MTILNKFIILIIVLITSCANNTLLTQCRLDKNNWYIVFEDNFDTYNSVSEMSNKWQFTPEPTCYGWGYEVGSSNINLNRGEYYDQSQVSLISGGILRLSSTKLSSTYTCTDGAIIRTYKWKSGMIQTKKGWDDPSDNYSGTWDDTGFRYGMFEIRCKLPSLSSFPAFWLYGGPTEIDIFEAGQTDIFSNNIHDYPSGDSISSLNCQNLYNNHPLNDFSSNFHTFTCVWTPT